MAYQIELPKAIYCLKLAQDSLLITAGQGNVIRIWDASSFKREIGDLLVRPQLLPVKTLQSTSGYSVYAMELVVLTVQYDKTRNNCSDPTITLIVTGGRENMVRFWDIDTAKEMLSITAPEDVVVHSLSHLVVQYHGSYSSIPFRNKGEMQNMREEVPGISFRLFAGCDNGAIYCWDIACDILTEGTLMHNFSNNYILSVPKFVTNSHNKDDKIEALRYKKNKNVGENNYSRFEYEQFEGVYYGHENVVCALLQLTPFRTTIPDDCKSRSISGNSSYHRYSTATSTAHRFVLVSASRDLSDVRLWQADFNFRESASNINSQGGPFLCKLATNHTGRIVSLGLITQDEKSAQIRLQNPKDRILSQKKTFDVDIVNVDDIGMNVLQEGKTFCHLVTCGSSNKVCVWNIYQVLKDLHWEQIKWFVILTKQISMISYFKLLTTDCNYRSHYGHRYAGADNSISKDDSINITKVRRSDTPKISVNSIHRKTPDNISDDEPEELLQLRLILMMVVSRQDILSVVSSFLL